MPKGIYKRKPRPEFSLESLRETLLYDPDTGLFSRIKHQGGSKCVGSKVGSPHKGGYVQIKIFAVLYLAHRLAWFYTYGSWPIHRIDHIDGNRTNNKLSNLREATDSQNSQNMRKRKTSKSKYKGCSWRARTQVWEVYIRFEGKRIYLGAAKDEKTAALIYDEGAIKYFGEFANLNFKTKAFDSVIDV